MAIFRDGYQVWEEEACNPVKGVLLNTGMVSHYLKSCVVWLVL